MKKTLKELCTLVSGELSGDPKITVSGVSNISDAGPEDISFVLDPRFLKDAENSEAKVLILPKTLSTASKPSIKVENPRIAMSIILEFFQKSLKGLVGIHKTAVIGANGKKGKDIYLGAYAVVGDRVKLGNRVKIFPTAVIGNDVTIGDDTIIYPHVSIYDNIIIGKKVILHSGVVIGCDGFGFVQDNGVRRKIPQVGTVIIEDEVEVQANSCIDRATMGKTIIKKGTKIDNLVQVAHNVVIGENSVLVAQAGIAGSAKVGNNVIVAGQSGVTNYANIGDNSIILGRSGVTHNIAPETIVSGFPAQEHKKNLHMEALIRRLPSLFKRFEKIEKHFNEDRPIR
ncbi:MAG: UDP-3-O-(3-hydroxymyristoyl)glucosamine N-acyltransferase [bacterium]